MQVKVRQFWNLKSLPAALHQVHQCRATMCIGAQVQTGVPPEQALMVLVPEAYRNHPDLVKKYPEVRGAPCTRSPCTLTVSHLVLVYDEQTCCRSCG